ncbi:MAG: hypothetical protein R3C61_23770 [Bacteroidia bacterium]
MKTAKLIKQGKGWQLVGEKTLPVMGNFGLTEDMNGQEVEFDNTGGPVKLIRFNGKDYTKQQQEQQDMGKVEFQKSAWKAIRVAVSNRGNETTGIVAGS